MVEPLNFKLSRLAQIVKEVEELGYDLIPSGLNFIVKLLMLPQIYKELGHYVSRSSG